MTTTFRDGSRELSDRQTTNVGTHEGPPGGGSPFLGVPTEAGNLVERLCSLLDLSLQASLKLGASADKLAANYAAAMERLQRFTPVDAPPVASAQFVSPGPLLLNLGSPDAGTYWEVESVIVGGTDFNVTAAGQAGLYVTGVPSVTGGLMNAADRAPSLPNVGFYGGRNLTVNDFEYLVVAIFNGTPGQVYVANASITALNVAAAGGRDITVT